jgi:hypothetical protein
MTILGLVRGKQATAEAKATADPCGMTTRKATATATATATAMAMAMTETMGVARA